MELAQECSLHIDEAGRKIEGVSIDALLNEFGTPLFVVSERIIREKYRLLAAELNIVYPFSRIAYSFKTNYVTGICKMLKECGALAEAVSGFEYWLAKKIGYSGPNIIFNGPYKKDDELMEAVSDGCILNIDNRTELERLNSLLGAHSRPARIGLRLNANNGRENSRPWNRFGFNVENGEASQIFTKTVKDFKNVTVCGIHMHLGTNIEDVEQYRLAVEKIVEFILDIKRKLGVEIEYIDAGGGFPVSGNKLLGDRTPGVPHIKNYLRAIAVPIKRALSTPLLFIEPGRFLIAEGITLLTKVISRKEINSSLTATVDCSISSLRETSFIDFKVSAIKSGERVFPTTIFGCSCAQHDVLGRGQLPILNVGDVLAIHNVGAYSIPRSSQWIFPRPAIVCIKESGDTGVLRRKEVYEDIICLDQP